MGERNRDDRFNYTKQGEFHILEMQCKSCKHKSSNPMVCKKFLERKPTSVLRVETDCSKFEPEV
jgi:hypothetical protein